MLPSCFEKFAPQRGLQVGHLVFGLLALAMLVAVPARAAIVWDGEGGSQWWFDPANWNAATNVNTVLPPSNNAAGSQATDTQINIGTGVWNQGEGVVFDPTNDPFFDEAEAITYPTNFNRQTINGLSMSRGASESTLLTIKGNLTFRDPVNVGVASGVRGEAANATIVQESGLVRMPFDDLVLATVTTTSPLLVGRGNGTYEYRGGTLEVAQDGGSGLILSVGSNSNAPDGQKLGPGGTGKFIIHNPSTPGHIRTFTLTTASFAGFDEGAQGVPTDSEFNAAFDADGETTGVGIFEFHYANGGTRPIQVNTDLILNNGLDNNTKGKRSSRLGLVLDEPACAEAGCMPNNIGLFDVAFDGSGLLLGSGDLDGNGNFTDDRVFSSIDTSTQYREGDIVSAVFGSTEYNWTISYTGDINWSNADDSEISSITGMGTGNDIVLIGHSSSSMDTGGDFDGDGDVDGRDFLAWQRGESPDPFSADDLADWQTSYGAGTLISVTVVPEPGVLALICAAILPAWGRRRIW
jgi:hypothetical protein